MAAVRGSLGGALEVAARVGGTLGAGLAHLAKEAFVSGMDLGLARVLAAIGAGRWHAAGGVRR